MNRFSFHRADTIEQAVKALSNEPAARIIAGGSNLVDLMKYNVETPSTLIDGHADRRPEGHR